MERQYHKQDWVGEGQWKELAHELNLLARRVNNIQGSNGIHVVHDWKNIKISNQRVGGASYPFSVQAGTDPEDVTITGGVLEWMGKLTTYTLADAQQEITGGSAGSPHFVYIEFNGSTISAPATAASTRPVSDDQTYRKVLAYAWLDTSGTTNTAKILSPRRWAGGDIECYWGV